MPTQPFKGFIKLDVRFQGRLDTIHVTEGAGGSTNVLFVLYDDTGQAAWSPFGGPPDNWQN